MSPHAPAAYACIIASALIKTGPGILHAANMVAPADTCTLTLYDNTAGSGTAILYLKAVLNTTAGIYLGNVAFSKGLYASLAGTTPGTTIIYS